MLHRLLPLLALLLLACDEPDPVQSCEQVAQDHCAKIADCVFTPLDMEACLALARDDLGCARVADTTSALDRCEREVVAGTCANYNMLPLSCRDAFTR